MTTQYKMIFCIDSFHHRGGASIAMKEFISHNNKILNYIIFCKEIIYNDDSGFYNIKIGSGKDVIDYYFENNYDIIHWYKSNGTKLFDEICTEIKKNKLKVNLISTICQKPSFKELLVTPNELINSKKIIFIDKASYDDKLLKFINHQNKSMIYFGCSEKQIQITEEILKQKEGTEKDTIVFGRGSSLNKCPPTMLSAFDKINIPKKKMIIVGGEGKSWLTSVIEKRKEKNVELLDNVPYQDWLRLLSHFDIFLYHLPTKIYSSIDGTLGDAMLLKKAVVYFGPEAPKERLVNGVNGFIAKTEKEIPKLCSLLATDERLRNRLGENARLSTIEDFNIRATVEKYNSIYYNILNNHSNNVKGIKIPLSYLVYYFFIQLALRSQSACRKILNQRAFRYLRKRIKFSLIFFKIIKCF